MTLAADRVLDYAWRAGIGVATAVTRAQELSDPLRCNAAIRYATLLVSHHQTCSQEEALSRLLFVSHHTSRRVQDIAAEVIASAAAVAPAQALDDPVEPRPYRFTL
jgi:hypothetical protein